MNEMDRSNRRIDSMASKEMNKKDEHPKSSNYYDCLYDEAWKSEESDPDGCSLQEVPIPRVDDGQLDDSGCEAAVSTAIAEVSKGYLSGLRLHSHVPDSDESRISSDSEFKLLTGFPAYARYQESGAGLSSDTDWNPYGTESDTNASPHVLDSADRSNECKLSFNPPLNSTDLNTVTQTTYPTLDFDSRYDGTGTMMKSLKADDDTQDFSSISHVSDSLNSPVRIKLPVRNIDLNQTMRDKGLFDKNGKRISKLQYIPEKEIKEDNKLNDSKDTLGEKIQQVLSNTEHLEARQGSSKQNLDYDMLRRDLQDITDSLHRTDTLTVRDTAQGHRLRERQKSNSSEEIIPSTTNTPEKLSNKMMWDFAADFGYNNNHDGLLRDISLDTYTSNSQRPSTEKYAYNSDGNDTQTSGSSAKFDDHAAADQAIAEMSELLQTPSGPLYH